MATFKEIISNFFHQMQRISFLLLLVFLLGVASGGYGMFKLYQDKMKDAVDLRGMIIEGKVYELKIRP